MRRHIIAAAVAALSSPVLSGVIGGPADGMGPMVTDHGPLVNQALSPAPHAGWGVQRIKATTLQPVQSGIGSFRITCYPAWISHNDPLVWPNKKDATHLHIGFGATSVDHTTTDPAMLDAMASSCQGGTVNTSAYWVPCLIDTRTGGCVKPDHNMVYYKTGYNGIKADQVRTIPNGLRMIAGNAKNAAKSGPVQHKCDGKDPATGTYVPAPPGGWSQDIPNCPVGTRLLAEVWFGQCLAIDEQGAPVLDSQDHKAHVAYTVSPPNAAPLDANGVPVTQYANGRWCPSSHPHPIPEVRYVINYPAVTEPDQLTHYRYSSDMYHLDESGNVIPGGRGFHADYIKWWDADAWASILSLLQQSKDGHAYLLGNGWMIY